MTLFELYFEKRGIIIRFWEKTLCPPIPPLSQYFAVTSAVISTL